MLRTTLVLLTLLASVAPASAGCAWVLWTVEPHRARGIDWAVVAAMETGGQRFCEETADDLRARAKERGLLVDYVCLPDTIDPRGPKASGR